MAMPRGMRGTRSAIRQRGQALIITAVLIAVGMYGVIFTTVSTTSVAIANRQAEQTRSVLMQAREALIGRAASDDNRPGSLPCPDTDDDGVAEIFVAGNACPSYLGRLPWKTLRLPDPRDIAGERLWYALAPAFRDHAAAGLLDSDTKGSITVYGDSMATAITTEAVAVIFAPGPAVSGQIRDPASANNPANYLDSTAGVNNAIDAGPFIAAQASSTFNDRLLVITTAELMPVVEMRAAREMLALLQSYRSATASTCACYPWAADDFDDDSVNNRTRGMVPIENALPETWGSLSITVPEWMIGANEWGKKFYYAIAPSESASHTAGTLTVDGASKNLVLITTGPAGTSRPSVNLSNYLDDAENSNGDNIFQTPSSTAYARDRLYILP